MPYYSFTGGGGGGGGVTLPPTAGFSPSAVLQANNTWTERGTGIQLTPGGAIGTLDGITFSSTWSDPMTLSWTGGVGVAEVTSEIWQQTGNTDFWLVSGGNVNGQLTRRRSVFNGSSITFGIYSGSFSCSATGLLIFPSSSKLFRIQYESFGTSLADMHISRVQ
jgi:hypothetical protein